MNELAQLKRLTTSQRWSNFVESAANGLQLHITLFFSEETTMFSTPQNCSSCRKSFTPFTQAEVLSLKAFPDWEFPGCLTPGGAVIIVLPLSDKLYMAARECSCHTSTSRLPLVDRANISWRLLSSFQSTMIESHRGGQRATQLSTLRQINHIIFSLFQEGENALERAYDLILSALVILCDAQGSWLEYHQGTNHLYLIRGDEDAVRAYQEKKIGDAQVAELGNNNIYGSLGVLGAVDPEQDEPFLSLLAQECSIVSEIDYLFQLVKKQLSLVLGSVGSAIILVDQYGCISYVNHAAEKLLGRDAIGLIGNSALDLPVPWSPFLQYKTEQNVTRNMDLLGQGDSQKWIDWQLSPMRDQQKVMGWVVIADDRSDYYRWQEAGRQAERLAVTASMIGSLAHELRNPLSAAKGLLQLINRKRDPERVAAFSNLIIRELDRVTRLLNEFLILGKTAEKSTELVHLDAFLQELYPLFEGETIGTEVEVITDLGVIPPVLLDQGQLTQAVMNLVRNAIEAAGEKGIVTIRLRDLNQYVLLEVEDNGPGLSPDAREKLFKPFFTTKNRGTGLGLSVTQAIIHNHGGYITAASGRDGGALFSVYLPAYTAKPGQPDHVDVMIAVSDNLMRIPCEQALRAAGFSTISVPDLSNFSILAETHQPEIILLDQLLLSGENLNRLRLTWPNAELVILGEHEDLNSMNLKCIPRPRDYGCLISYIKTIKKTDSHPSS